MDLQKLLTRGQKSTKKSSRHGTIEASPSSRHNAQPQLHPTQSDCSVAIPLRERKRKRGQGAKQIGTELNFFGDDASPGAREETAWSNTDGNIDSADDDDDDEIEDNDTGPPPSKKQFSELSIDNRKRLLREHKLKITWLNPSDPQVQERRRKEKQKNKSDKAEKVSIYPLPLGSFAELKDRYDISHRIAANIQDQGYAAPTEVQLGAIPLLLEQPKDILSSAHQAISTAHHSSVDLLTVAPTGSGKTLAFAVPLLHNIIEQKRLRDNSVRKTSAVILAPTKELASQIVNECRKLARNSGVKVTQVRKGMRIAAPSNTGSISVSEVEEDENEDENDRKIETIVKSDILVSTPGILAAIVTESQKAGAVLSDVQNLILDEADVLLHPLFREQTLSIWQNLSHVDMRVSLWSATMGSNIEELARSVIRGRRTKMGFNNHEAPLIRLVVGLKDSAIPNIEHRLVYAASEQGKLMGLRQLLHPTTATAEAGPPILLPFLVFTQTIERAVALHSELLYDIPAEAGGISRIAVLHSDLSDTARDSVMTKFRKGEIWVLITTDLLSRGVDFRGVNGVVNYDMPTSSAAYVHRVGRTGRAGREGGVAVTLYSKEDVPYIKNIANVIAAAEKQKSETGTAKENGLQKWLLDALPSLSKQAKQDLKKHGVESRTARGAKKDPKAARKSRISTKAGYVRREEDKKKGAIQGSQRRQEDHHSDEGETDFGGFD